MEKLFKYINLYIIKNAKNKKIKPLTNINKLYYFAYFCDDKFITFEIPKLNDKKRTIYTTKYKTHKIILEAINEYLYEKVKFPRYVHGYVKKKNVATNAKVHVGKKFIFKVDIKDFFPSIHKGKIIWALKNYLDLDEKLAFLIASLATIKINDKEFLPQGFPISPVLSNLVLKRVDRRLIGLAKKYHIKYTRYADDITFSSDKNIFDENFINEVEKILNKDSFKLNYEKTKLLKKGYRQTVTGLVVNEKLNVKREYVKLLRTLIFYLKINIEKYGLEKGKKEAQKIFKQKSGSNKNLLEVIRGKLAYLKLVKGENDSTYLKLKNTYFSLIPEIKKNKVKKENVKQSRCVYHNPKKVVDILTQFSEDEDLRYVMHSWDEGLDFTYEEFIKKVKIKWEQYQKDLFELNNKLSAKIYNFLLERNPSWGRNRDNKYGWSSFDLIECFKKSHNPFECELENGKKFGDIIDDFRNEIRLQVGALYDVLNDLISEYELNFEDIENEEILEDIDVYVDTQWLKIGLERIFKVIKKRRKNKIKLIIEKIDNYFDLYIINIDSETTKTPKELIEKAKGKGGDFFRIRESLCSVVDWFIIIKNNEKIYEINMFEETFEEKNYNFYAGFTYKLRFYQ